MGASNDAQTAKLKEAEAAVDKLQKELQEAQLELHSVQSKDKQAMDSSAEQVSSLKKTNEHLLANLNHTKEELTHAEEDEKMEADKAKTTSTDTETIAKQEAELKEFRTRSAKQSSDLKEAWGEVEELKRSINLKDRELESAAKKVSKDASNLKDMGAEV